MAERGLRERKKQETRQRISDVATGLFAVRGFDDVKVVEVAEAAEVSKMTVFNYFPRKEDLFFDRGEEAVALLTETITERPPGESVLGALRRLSLRLLAEGHPFGAVGEGYERFFQVVRDSPALQARGRELVEGLEDLLTSLIASATGADAEDPQPRLVAALGIAAYRTAYLTSARRLLAGEPIERVRDAHERLLRSAYDALERAFPGYGADQG
jgi:AcrR family transcriptional regulator